ncbi:MAG: bifunctional (p)ppGpp synthetase/guanosine-3',5'-bis(diphosphate) 3'-pyrophosphohydrolase [Candidatus Yonathbacteria bacterium]|nr:bifunctional (p)ppGpp synthetase/guanosine-3',5'-bis(diphosphate) 3'-pyrophosphohydrolase [Candidatus Yonathbacteria bacterium]NTW48022.1 bifunctional (p)ppGpp synthetase/guanosine-3',5'-bis(diphosphate) 3'-pyrophosphohydrolase [Candidatus Yonathbacteria bacterium]
MSEAKQNDTTENHDLDISSPATLPDVQDILSLMTNPSETDIALIKKAYEAALQAHEGVTRFTGEPYFNHVFETAKTLARMHMDATTIAAGFLHDTIEDGHMTEKEMEEQFGTDILFLVDGVTKLGKLKYRGMERHTESLRKLFIATAKDIRVIMIRLADRLHNVTTLYGHPKEDKRKRIALETLEIYAPLADRLGIGFMKGELEDAAFEYAYPEDYKKVKELLKQKSKTDQDYLEKVRRTLQKSLAEEKIDVVHMDYRIKKIYSLFRKLKRKNMEIDKVYDIVALRVIVPTVSDCYRVLGVIHGLWRPLPGRIKDYIALPKLNGYQSIHTTIFTGDGGIAEIQVRTPEMHAEAELGIASHVMYKELGANGGNGNGKKLDWIEQLLEAQKTAQGGEFLKDLRMDFFSDRVFVFTPAGDVVDLPTGSSPVDFAFTIHTDIGMHMSGAKVNGKMVSLDTPLVGGDIVEIITAKHVKPTSKWLKYAKSSMAQRRIRAYLQKEGAGSGIGKFWMKG